MNITNEQELKSLGLRIDICATLPKLTAENVDIDLYGTKRGKGATRIFGSGFSGKTVKILDNQGTVATECTITFEDSDFLNPMKVTLAELVVAFNTKMHVAMGANHPLASAGAIGELIITSFQANAAGLLTLGNGTANELLGFPSMGYSVDQATTIVVTLPAETAYPSDEALYNLCPRVEVMAYTAASGVLTALTPVTGYAVVWTPSTRILTISDGSGDAARVARIVAVL